MNRAPSLSVRARAAAVAALTAACVAAVTMTGGTLHDPGVRLEMADAHPAIVSGLYPAERVDRRTFAWSGDHVRLTLPGADRRVAWSCDAEVINWRPPAAGPAQVTVTSGDDVLTTASVAAPEATLSFTIPAAAGSAFDVRIQVAPTFRPGPSDTRSLGLAFDRIVCAPRDDARAWPPLGALGQTTLAAALLGTAIGASGLAIVPAAALAAGSGALLAAAATLGTGPYVPGAPPLLLLSALAACVWFAPIWALDLTGWRTLSSFARAAVAFSAAACAVKLAFILHQDKPIVDALFHAHRFARVLDGQYYFTQLSTSATPFPYAIGLYLFAQPWSALTDDHVLLLRIIVYGAEAGAGLLLYAMLAKVWEARSAGVAAVVLFHLAPLPFAVIGNANMTNAFGQSASLAVVAAATTWTFVPRGLWAFAGLALLAALAFISHVSIVVLLAATCAALVVAAWVLADRETRRQVHRAFAAAVAGAVLAVVLYWGHFGDVYRAPFERMTGGTSVSAPAAPGTKPARAPFTYTAADLGRQVVRDIGWPLLVLAAAGAVEVVRGRRRDRLSVLVAAWLGVGAAFLTAGALMPIGPRMQQDAWEFMGRVTLAVYPALAILAGVGVARGWESGIVWRGVSATLVGAAFVLAGQALLRWY